jgi:hypothetical protein
VRFKSDEDRQQYYIDKYGEEEGWQRFQASLAKQGRAMPDEAMDSPQASILHERAPRRASPSAGNRKPSKKEVTSAVGAGIALANKGLVFLWPPWVEDMLNPMEVGLLADALADEILSSRQLTKLLVSAASNSVHMKLAYVCAIIAVPRLQRRGMLPDFGPMMAQVPNANGSLPEDYAGPPEGPTTPPEVFAHYSQVPLDQPVA